MLHNVERNRNIQPVTGTWTVIKLVLSVADRPMRYLLLAVYKPQSWGSVKDFFFFDLVLVQVLFVSDFILVLLFIILTLCVSSPGTHLQVDEE